MNLRIPKEVHLGCGAWIKVVEVARTEIQAQAGRETDAFWVETFDSEDKYYGRIYLDKTLPKRIKREKFYHELSHAITDMWGLAIHEAYPQSKNGGKG